MNALAKKVTQGWQDHGAVRNALVAKAIDDFNNTATTSEPFADGAKVYPEPPAGIKQGGFDWLQWNASLQGPDAHARVKAIADKAKAEGRDTPNIYEMLEMGSMIPGQMLQGAISAAASGLTLPGDVAAGRQQVMDPTTGNVDVGAIGRALDLTGLMSSGSFAGAPKGALGSGPVRAPYPKDTFTQPTPFEYAKGSKYRDAVNDVSDTVANYYGKTEVVDPKTLSTRDRTLNPQIVQEYVADPARTPDVAPGRSGSDAMAVRYGGKTVIVDGNHRAAAALASDRPLEMRVVDMDKAYADAASVKVPEQGVLGAMFDYIGANPKGVLGSGPVRISKTPAYLKDVSFTPAEQRYLDLAQMTYEQRVRQGTNEEFLGIMDGVDAKSAHAKINAAAEAKNPGVKEQRKLADTLFENGTIDDAEYEALLAKVEQGGKVDPDRVAASNAEAQSVIDAQIAKNPNFLEEQAVALGKAVQESADENSDYVVPKPVTLHAGGKSLAPLLAADFSHAARIVDSLPTIKAPADQWLATLKNKGVKDEELDALNLPSGGQVLTKAEIQAKIAEGTPKIEEVVKKGSESIGDDGDVFETRMADRVTDDVVEEFRRDNPNATQDDVDAYLNEDSTIDRIWEETQNRLENAPSEGGGTKYEQYQLPGGDNYREILVTMPPKSAKSLSLDETAKAAFVASLSQTFSPEYAIQKWEALAPDIRQRWMDYAAQGRDDPAFNQQAGGLHLDVVGNYTSSHWDESNVLGHMRVNDRNVDGLKTLHAEELQSDWHQMGKKAGYVRPDEFAKTPEGFAQQADAGKASAVPDAPFKKSWPDLLLKRLVKRAVDEGYDAISWTDGATQANRYDLSKQVDNIRARKNSDGSYVIDATPRGGKGYQSISNNVSANDLPNLIGKELADKVIKDAQYDAKAGNPFVNYSGLDLKVGGEGMKAFYDQELPRRAKKLLGTAVEKRALGESQELEGAKKYLRREGPYGDDELKDKTPQQIYDMAIAVGWNMPPRAVKQGPDVHFVRLTPEVKARIAKGFPLYSTGVPLISDDGKYRLVPVDHNPFEGEQR